MKKTYVLVVLDGWGLGRSDESNPIWMVKPKTFAMLEEKFPMASLQASGISVGLPWGETGNSEVGHLTLGSGKVIYQYYPRITISIQDKTFFENPALIAAFDHAKKNSTSINIAGLLSHGNVHASIEHLLALIQMAKQREVPIKLHLFADGKDGKPRSLEALLAQIPQDRLASLAGRYYAMDREENWDLVRLAYDCMTGTASPTKPEGLADSIAQNYEKNKTEEHLVPLLLRPELAVAENDALIFLNFREDSIREIARAFIEPDFAQFPVHTFEHLFIATMTQYQDSFNVPVAFPPEYVKEPLGKVLADAGKTQLRLAESYKQAHVTYFFNGLNEAPFPNEYRVIIPSHAMPHPDEYPAMMAESLTDRLVEAINNRSFDFILVNYANPDTIAHTGNFKATEEAVRVIDKQLERVVVTALAGDAIIAITSDHGNAEEVADPQTGRMETGHDANPVPFYLVGKEFEGKKFSNVGSLRDQTIGIISDVAPTILALMGIPKPADMTGESLLRNLL